MSSTLTADKVVMLSNDVVKYPARSQVGQTPPVASRQSPVSARGCSPGFGDLRPLPEAHWLEAVGAVLFIGVLVGTGYVRRRNVVTKARRMQRERADWPQRLDEWRS